MTPFNEYEEEFEFQEADFEWEQEKPVQAPRTDSVQAVRKRLASMSLSPGLARAIQQRRPVAREFAEFNELYEVGAKPAKKKAMVLSFKIPEAPYSDGLLAGLHKLFEIIEGVEVVITVFEAEVLGLLGTAGAAGLGVAFGVVAPFAAFLANMAALGSGYAEARAKIAKDRIRFGFALGVVMGADWRAWDYAKRLFWKWSPEVNTFDQDAGKIAQRAFNLGLASGFIQGRKLSKKQRQFFWPSLATTLTPGDRAWFSGGSKSWGERLWIDWYIRAAASFLKLYAKD